MERDELNYPITIVSIICVLMLIALVFGPVKTVFDATEDAQVSVSEQTEASTTQAPTTQAPATTAAPETTAAPTTTAAPETTAAPVAQPAPSDTTAAADTTAAPAESTTAAATNALPATPEAILAKYTEVVDKAKSEGPAHKKIEYQAIPEDKVNFEGGVFGKMLPLISNFLKTEEDARANPEAFEKGNDMYWFPPYRVTKGCMLTDVSKIKSATCEEQPDGNVKITIVLNDEANPEPPAEGATSCDNATGSMFTPIKRADIDNTLQNDGAVKFIVKDVDFDLNYHDCTAELVYNPSNDQIVSLDQYMHIFINIKSGTLLGMSAVGTAELNNNLHLSDFAY